MILVLGASGNIGKATVNALKEMDADFVGGYRRAEEAQAAKQSGINTVLVDYNDLESLRAACQGKTRVFMVSTPGPSLVTWEGNVLKAAQESGVELLVKSSAWGTEADDFLFAHPHRESEKAIEASGIPYAFICPNGFFQNVFPVAPVIKAQGLFPVPVGDAPVSEIDVFDIGQVVATILTGEGHAGKRYTLSGPEAITTDQKAQILSARLGRPISSVAIPAEQWKPMAMSTGVPEPIADGIIDLQNYYIAGRASAVLPTVQNITGKSPRSFQEFIDENLAGLLN